MQPEADSLTRRQLIGMGLSKYLAAALTKDLPVVGKKGNAFEYGLASVLSSTRSYSERRRIQPKTRELMTVVIKQLQSLLGNVVSPSFQSNAEPDVRRAMAKLQHAMSETDRSMAKLKTRAGQLKAEHGAPA